jgi:hypothetical protein
VGKSSMMSARLVVLSRKRQSCPTLDHAQGVVVHRRQPRNLPNRRADDEGFYLRY